MPIGEGKSVTIVGAGLVGSLLACVLAKQGFRVAVYERRPDPRRAGYVGGRSINLALSARGLWGLAGIGLDQEMLRHAIPMKGRMIHPVDLQAEGATLAFQPYSHDPRDAINSISRGGLNLALIEAQEMSPSIPAPHTPTIAATIAVINAGDIRSIFQSCHSERCRS